MFLFDHTAKALSWLGRQGTRAVAALVIIGIAVPPLGALLKPLVTETIFVLLCFAFMRVDLVAFRAYLKRPAVVLAATAWTSVFVPLIFAAGCLGLGLPAQSPDLFLALMLQAIASPIMAAPAFASLIGLDAALVLATLITSTALIPLTAPLFATLFLGPALSLAPLALGLKLSAILAGSALVGFGARRVFGLAAIEKRTEAINGCNIIFLFIFVAVIMEKVAGRFLAAPLLVIGLIMLAFSVYFAVLLLSTLLFWRTGRQRALALGFLASQRNMGLMLAATGGALPEMTWLYFALAQFPIYLGPYLLQPLARRLLERVGHDR
ncbi:MAG: Na+-dependent transporter [Desulfofustis sp.]|nr:Na+-dependent transporter [Desulfofustis sp.]